MPDERSGTWEGYGAAIPKNPDITIDGMASSLRDGQIELFAVSDGSLYRSLPYEQRSLTWKEIPKPSTIGKLSKAITVVPFGASFLNVIGIANGKVCHVSGDAFTFARHQFWFQFDLPAGTSQTLVAACSPRPGKLLLVVPENKPTGRSKIYYASFYNETWSPWRSWDSGDLWADVVSFGSLSAISTAPDRVDVLFMCAPAAGNRIDYRYLVSTDGGESLVRGGSYEGGSPFNPGEGPPHIVALTNPGGLTAIMIAKSSAVAARHLNGIEWGQYTMGNKGTGYGNAASAVATSSKRVDAFVLDASNQLSPRRYNLP